MAADIHVRADNNFRSVLALTGESCRVVARQRRVAMTRVPWRGREGDVAAGDALGAAGGGAQVEAAQDLAQHDAHLHLGERGAEAAAHAAAVGDPRVRRGRLVEEALRAEGVRVRVGLGAGVGEPDRGGDVGAGGEVDAVGDEVGDEPPARRAGRPGAAAATRRRPRAGTRRPRPARARQHVRVAGQQVERPGQAGGGRLVPGQQQRHQLVADLAVAHRGAVLEARLGEQRADVGPRGSRAARRSRPAAARRCSRTSRAAARAASGGRTAPRTAARARPSCSAGRAGGRAAGRARSRRRPPAGSPRA